MESIIWIEVDGSARFKHYSFFLYPMARCCGKLYAFEILINIHAVEKNMIVIRILLGMEDEKSCNNISLCIFDFLNSKDSMLSNTDFL
jgi:hypothetical protein